MSNKTKQKKTPKQLKKCFCTLTLVRLFKVSVRHITNEQFKQWTLNWLNYRHCLLFWVFECDQWTACRQWSAPNIDRKIPEDMEFGLCNLLENMPSPPLVLRACRQPRAAAKHELSNQPATSPPLNTQLKFCKFGLILCGKLALLAIIHKVSPRFKRAPWSQRGRLE